MQENKSIEELLFKREIWGLKIANGMRVFVCLLMLPITYILAEKESNEFIFTFSVIFCILIYTLYSIQSLYRKAFCRQIGYVGASMDALAIPLLQIIWYNSAGGTEIIASYLLKTRISDISFLLITINSLTLFPAYPLIVFFSMILTISGSYLYVISQENIFYTSDWVETLLGSSVNVADFFTRLLTLSTTGFAIIIITYIARKMIRQAARMEIANEQLGRYFSPSVAKKITEESAEFLQPGGKIQKVTVLFSDIRNFTSISESLHPKEVLSFLSEYHEKMVEIIFKHGGTLDKFIGDAIMATFGTPEPGENDTLRAALSAREMCKALKEINIEREKKGLFPIHHGIGIHSGEALVGNMGTKNRLEYTVLGDTVNIASRIESSCKTYQQSILFSQMVKTEIENKLETVYIDTIELKGKTKSTELYTLKL
ncbi:MAG: adenylate/guanylate cyclase domain-containing protein [Leptospiraceae bacterium]|nr:adenylate/guanylate cyclase domain-containing protein [Leptospiraceae bacterium]MCP5503123.1 adenylate/guanylate cyclase domain-containing protein [Leptospiraceae bacterium]